MFRLFLKVIHRLLGIGEQIGEVMRFFARKLEHGADRVERFVEVTVEVVQDVIQRAKETPVAKNIATGYEKWEKFLKATELVARLDRTTTGIVAFILGRSCFTATTASWTASACVSLYGIIFITMLAGSVFAFYMIGHLSHLRL